MFDGPIRGGTRGGAGEFKWADVSADKDRENYLGHSVNAPTGRWQKRKDVHWYSRDAKDSELARAEEIRRIKAAEADVLAIKLGFKAPPKPGEVSNVPITSLAYQGPALISDDVEPPADAAAPAPTLAPGAAEKEERRRHKEERRARKEEERARKEQRRAERDGRRAHRHDHSRTPPRRRNSPSRSRSPSPRRERDSDARYVQPRDRTPTYPARGRSPEPARAPRPRRDSYQHEDMERERNGDRQRWEQNTRREAPGNTKWGR